MTIKAIIFDLDGTLADTLPICVRALKDVFQQYLGVDYSTAEIFEMFGPTEEGILRTRVSADAFPGALELYLRRYRELHEFLPEAFPGVIHLLSLLRERGTRVGIVTGKGPHSAEISMHVLGLEPYIEQIITGHEHGTDKSPSIRKMLDGWGVPPEQAAYVGDMIYDMRAAREAGVLPLAAAWAGTETFHESDGAAKVFTSVDEMIRWAKTV
ncbi:MAG: HAD family hydrolase [Chloroflexi bacterium]|nr:MAG: HAD family hydrolase [Chloroflexota bacterium]